MSSLLVKDDDGNICWLEGNKDKGEVEEQLSSSVSPSRPTTLFWSLRCHAGVAVASSGDTQGAVSETLVFTELLHSCLDETKRRFCLVAFSPSCCHGWFVLGVQVWRSD